MANDRPAGGQTRANLLVREILAVAADQKQKKKANKGKESGMPGDAEGKCQGGDAVIVSKKPQGKAVLGDQYNSADRDTNADEAEEGQSEDGQEQQAGGKASESNNTASHGSHRRHPQALIECVIPAALAMALPPASLDPGT